MRGKIVEIIADISKVEIKEEIYTAKARGIFRKEDISPVVGDIVEIEIIDENKKEAVINKIEERKNYVKRPKISNISQLILVVSMKNPKPDLLMLDKQLLFAEFLNIKPIIVLNKIDLDDEKLSIEIKEIYTELGYEIIETEAKNDIGIERIHDVLKNNISAFSGNSGVGKSTLINKIFSREITEEGLISERNKRGKNTTTIVKLYKISDETYIADTPGFSTFSIEEIPYKELEKYYVEFEKYRIECKYIGCSHINEGEAECGIKQAVKNKSINKQRYERFCKIYEELKNKEERKKW